LVLTAYTIGMFNILFKIVPLQLYVEIQILIVVFSERNLLIE